MIVSDSIVQNLRDLFTEIGAEGSLEDCLAELSALVARILRVEGCTIVLLTEEEAFHDDIGKRTGFGSLYRASGVSQPARRRASQESDATPFASQGTQDYESMFSKIVLNGKVIGVIEAELPLQQKQFGKDDLDLFSILTPIITKSIQVIRLQHLLRSRFSQVALIRENGSPVADVLSLGMEHPNKIARILAKSFYREMLSAGFSFNQIIFAATEVISELSVSVRKIKCRQKNPDGADADRMARISA